MAFFLQVILDFLSTTVCFPLPYLPNPSLEYGIHLAVDPGNLLCFFIPIKESKKSVGLDPLNPQDDGLPMFPQLLSNMYLGYSLLMEFPGKRNER